MSERTCSVEGCDAGGKLARGLCNMHYCRVRRGGEPGEIERRRFNRVEQFWDFVDKDGPVPDHRPNLGPCWVWTAGTTDGYGYLATGGAYKLAHRIAWEKANGPIPDGMWVLHHCDNRPCVNYERHLFLGDRNANIRDMVVKGRSTAQLSREQVRIIRRRLASGASHRSVGQEFGVSKSTVTRINTGVTWAWLPDSGDVDDDLWPDQERGGR